MQVAVCAGLKSAGIDHYDFRNPGEGADGFHWSDVMPSYNKVDGLQGQQPEQLADMYEYILALEHPLAIEGFKRDWDAMNKATHGILILPCGRSAHLELGWMVGHGLQTAIMLDGGEEDKVTPELMYKMVDYLASSFFDLLDWLGVKD